MTHALITTFPPNTGERVAGVIGKDSATESFFNKLSGQKMSEEVASSTLCEALRLLPADQHLFINAGKIICAIFGTSHQRLFQIYRRVDDEIGWISLPKTESSSSTIDLI